MRSSGVLLVGASGLIGGSALPDLLQRAEHEDWQVWAPLRCAQPLTHPRLHTVVGELGTPAGQQLIEKTLTGGQLHAFVCALGSTLRAAGSQAAFAAIDRDLVLALGDIARRRGARQAIVVSSVGAAAGSSNFYLRVKGEMEQGIEALGFERVDFLQPGLLLGKRLGQKRPGERIGQMLAPLFNPLLPGPLLRYRAIAADSVAAALVALVGHSGGGIARHVNADIDDLAAGRDRS